MKKITNVMKVITINMVFIFSIYNAENIIPPPTTSRLLLLLLVVVKYEIRVASDAAKCLCYVGTFNGVGFIVVPICVLNAEVVVARIILDPNIREVAYRAVMRRGWKVIFYKDAFAIEVGIFRSFFSDEVHFAGLKVGWKNETKWSHWLDGVDVIDGFNFINSILWFYSIAPAPYFASTFSFIFAISVSSV
jgi:hypothetical protein